MIHAVSVALLGAAASALLLALTDAASQALGGDTESWLLSLAFLLWSFGGGVGRATPRPALWWSFLWLAAAGWLLSSAWLTGISAPLLAGPARSWSVLFDLLFLAAALGLPLHRLGAACGARWNEGGDATWNALLLGAVLGISAALAFGLGHWGFLLLLAFCYGLLALRRPRAAAGPPEAAPVSFLPAPTPWPARLPVAAAAFSLACGLSFLLPALESFDGSSAVQDAQRFLSLGGCAWFGAATLGTVLSRRRLGSRAAAIAGIGLAASWWLAALRVHDLADPTEFNKVVGWRRLLAALGQPEQRLMEGDWAYVAGMTFFTAALPGLLAGILWRITAELPRLTGGTPPLRRSDAGSATFQGAAAALLLAGVLGHPELDSWRGTAAFGAALLAGAASLWFFPPAHSSRALPRLARAAAGLLVLLLPAAVLPLPQTPRTGVPFFDNFNYTVASQDNDGNQLRGEIWGLSSIARVVQRSALPGQGSLLLSEGRNFLSPEADGEQARVVETAFLLALCPRPQRALLIGPPHAGTVRVLKNAGVGEVQLAVDPPELSAAAQAFLPAWRGLEVAPVVAAPWAAAGEFGFILIREEASWQRRRFPYRDGWFRACRQHLAPGGVLGVAVDLERATPGLIGGIARSMARSFPSVELWLVPRGWHTPRLLISGRSSLSADPAPGLSNDFARLVMESTGLAWRNAADVELFRIAGTGEWRDLSAAALDAPLPPALARLDAVKYLRIDQIRPTERAAARLRELEQELGAAAVDSLLPFYARHLSSQVYSVHDTYWNAPPAEWLDVEEDALAELFELSSRHPASPFLREFWAELGGLLVAKREVEWCQSWYGALVAEGPVELRGASRQGLGWSHPQYMFVLGAAALEALDPATALEMADQVLAARSKHPDALVLRARALVEMERPAEAVESFAEAARLAAPAAPELLRAWAEAALAAGQEEQARAVAGDLWRRYGAEALGRDLRAFLGLDEPEAPADHPEHSGERPKGG